MKSSLARAIGSVITARTGFATFADEAANRKYTFPCVDVAIENTDEKSMGLGGRSDTYTKDGSGVPQKRVKKLRVEATVRLAAKAKQTQSGSSEAECVNVLETIRDDFDDIVYGNDVIRFIDPKTSEDLGVHKIRKGPISEPVLDHTGEPMLHVATMKLEIHHRRVHERPVENYIKSVAIQHEVIDGTT